MIYQKLLIIQNSIKVNKDRFNTFGNYKYRSAEDILNAAKPLLAQNNCILVLSDEVVNIGNYNYIKATAKIIDIEDGSEIVNTAYAREDEKCKGMQGSQITGATSSYSRKYALNGLFLLDDVKDADSNEFHYENTLQNVPLNIHPNTPMPKPILNKEEKIQSIIAEINRCNDVDSLTALWNRLKNWTTDESIKKAFSERKRAIYVSKKQINKF